MSTKSRIKRSPLPLELYEQSVPKLRKKVSARNLRYKKNLSSGREGFEKTSKRVGSRLLRALYGSYEVHEGEIKSLEDHLEEIDLDEIDDDQVDSRLIRLSRSKKRDTISLRKSRTYSNSNLSAGLDDMSRPRSLNLSVNKTASKPRNLTVVSSMSPENMEIKRRKEMLSAVISATKPSSFEEVDPVSKNSYGRLTPKQMHLKLQLNKEFQSAIFDLPIPEDLDGEKIKGDSEEESDDDSFIDLRKNSRKKGSFDRFEFDVYEEVEKKPKLEDEAKEMMKMAMHNSFRKRKDEIQRVQQVMKEQEDFDRIFFQQKKRTNSRSNGAENNKKSASKKSKSKFKLKKRKSRAEKLVEQIRKHVSLGKITKRLSLRNKTSAKGALEVDLDFESDDLDFDDVEKLQLIIAERERKEEAGKTLELKRKDIELKPEVKLPPKPPRRRERRASVNPEKTNAFKKRMEEKLSLRQIMISEQQSQTSESEDEEPRVKKVVKARRRLHSIHRRSMRKPEEAKATEEVEISKSFESVEEIKAKEEEDQVVPLPIKIRSRKRLHSTRERVRRRNRRSTAEIKSLIEHKSSSSLYDQVQATAKPCKRRESGPSADDSDEDSLICVEDEKGAKEENNVKVEKDESIDLDSFASLVVDDASDEGEEAKEEQLRLERSRSTTFIGGDIEREEIDVSMRRRVLATRDHALNF